MKVKTSIQNLLECRGQVVRGLVAVNTVLSTDVLQYRLKNLCLKNKSQFKNNTRPSLQGKFHII